MAASQQQESGLKRAIQERILSEMLGSISDGTGGGWKALVLDDLTTKILSSAVKMTDLQDCNVSVVEDMHKDREPLPLIGVYFIQPTNKNVDRLIRDATEFKLYPSMHVFFSSQLRSSLLNKIKDCPPLLKVLKALKETNLEYLMVDSRTVVTDITPQPDGLIRLMGPAADTTDADLNVIVGRLATLFSTLKDFPVIRYMLPPAPSPTDPPGARGRSTLTQRMATALLEKLVKQQQGGALPNKETCDMLILDRSYDPLAPVIHEWTYECMVYDLLPMDGNIFRYQAESAAPPTGKGGRVEEKKEVTIDERDPMWVELRHMFVADVYSAIATRFKEFQAKNKAAKVAGGGKATNEMSMTSIRGLIAALPQFHDILSRMSLHIQVSSDLKKVTNERGLTDLGEVEQDLVLGDKNSKDMLQYLAETAPRLTAADKVRLLMCYVATHPEKMDLAKRDEWMRAAGIGPQDMDAVCNLAYLGVQVMKLGEKEKGSFFGGKKSKKDEKSALRTPRQEDAEGSYALFRFEPLLRNLVTDLHANKLPLEQYPYIRTPSPEAAAEMRSSGSSASGAAPASARTRPGSLNWTKRGQAGEGGAAGGGSGRRLVVFIIGGAVRSEMRLVHQLSSQLGRDIILASSSIEAPEAFVDQLKRIGTPEAAQGY